MKKEELLNLFVNRIDDYNKNNKPIRIIFPEGRNKNIQSVANYLIENKIAQPILVFKNQSDDHYFANKEIIKIFTSNENLKTLASELTLLRKGKITINQASELIKTEIYYSAMELRKENLDCLVGGVVTTTADIIRPLLQIVKTANNVNSVSSMAILSKEKTFLLGDISINIDPTTEQVVENAFLMNQFATKLNLFEKNRTAFLSFSTNGSNKKDYPSVLKMRSAANTFKKNYPEYAADGEIQFDAAISEDVQMKKFQNNNIKGESNIFVFPNLDSANIGYKIMQRTADYDVFSLVLMGLKKVAIDLSRGAAVEEILRSSIVAINLAILDKIEK